MSLRLGWLFVCLAVVSFCVGCPGPDAGKKKATKTTARPTVAHVG